MTHEAISISETSLLYVARGSSSPLEAVPRPVRDLQAEGNVVS
jgi:hypothetical protein